MPTTGSRTRRSRTTDEDDAKTTPEDDDEEKPVRRTRRSEPADEEEKPARRSSRRSEPEEEEEKDEKPAARKRRKDPEEETGDEESAFDPALIARGWKEAKENRPESVGDWTNDFRWNEDAQLIKFLENDPWTYNQHWVEREGKRGFPCIARNGRGCPLCSIGVKLTQKYVFTILNCSKEPPTVELLQVGIQMADRIEDLGTDAKTGPLDRAFWAFSAKPAKGGRRNAKVYTTQMVKDRDVEEDWEPLVLDDLFDAVDAAEVPEPKDAITWSAKAELQEIADEVMK